MVLAIAFFTLVFSTLLWLMFALNYIYISLGAVSFASLGVVNISVYVAFVLLPILIVWLVFGFANQYLSNKTFNGNMYALFKQMKRNQEYSDLVSRVLLEAEQQIRDGFMFSHFDLMIADLNELIAELISRSNLANADQIERLWCKVQNGGKWAFAKVIVEINQNQQNFQMRIFEKSRRDVVLAGSVMEFCARYQSLINLLEKHDKERVYLNMIETGVYGKVFAILAPVADEVRKHRNSAQVLGGESCEIEDDYFRTEEEVTPPSARMPAPRPQPPHIKKPTFKKPQFKKPEFVKNLFKKKYQDTARGEPQLIPEKDPFSAALERSFGDPEPSSAPFFVTEEETFSVPEVEKDVVADEPHFEIEPPVGEESEFNENPLTEDKEEETEDFPQTDEIQTAVPELTDTQRTLNELKIEWENLKHSAASEPEINSEPAKEADNETDKEEAAAYPFGGWTDEGNYHK